LSVWNIVSAHALKRLGNVVRCRERQSRNDGTTRKNDGGGRQQDHCHRSARRKTRDEDTVRIGTMTGPNRLHHLNDLERLPSVASGVTRREPIEAKIWIICPLLLWEK